MSAGIGWSDHGPQPRTGRQIVTELHTLLHTGGIEPPYLLVGASFGGHYMRSYAARYPEEVAGFVFVDCSHEDMTAHFPRAIQRVFASTKYVLRTCALLALPGIMRLLGRRNPMVASLIQEGTPDELRRRLVWHYARPEQWRGMAAEAAATGEIEAEVRAAREEKPSFDDIPLVVLTAQGTWTDPKPRIPGVKPGEIAPIWLKLHQDLATLSTRSTHSVLDQQTHTGRLFSPAGAKIVVDAIREVVTDVRRDQSLHPN